MDEHVRDTIERAANPEHEWDKRAIDWPHLTSDSVVVEVGGYKGRWALQMANLYSPRLYVFEPQPWAWEVCCEVLLDRARVMEYALGVASVQMCMGEWETDGCSFLKEGTRPAWMQEITSAYRLCGIDHVDVMMMNIEGYEYRLLPYMIEKDILPDILIVQWHTFADPHGFMFSSIISAIELTHDRVWDYYPTLVAWRRR